LERNPRRNVENEVGLPHPERNRGGETRKKRLGKRPVRVLHRRKRPGWEKEFGPLGRVGAKD
jgi:hypothetical protein